MKGRRRVEVQARRFLWLFPAWLRSSRGEEAVSLVLDLLPAGARRLTVRARLDLVRAGLHARRIGRPPWAVRLGVLVAADRPRTGVVPAAWHPWLLGQFDSWWRARFVARRAVAGAAAVALVLLAASAARSAPFGRGGEAWSSALGGVGLVGGVALVSFGFASATAGRPHEWRARLLARNGLDDEARPLDRPVHQPAGPRSTAT